MKRITALIAILIMGLASAMAQNAAQLAGNNPVITDIINSYSPWQSVTYDGKLKMAGLPVTPTLKMYFEKDSLIQVSIRVPLLGEIGRMDMTRDEITVVNRMKKTYCRESTSQLLSIYQNVISDIQSIFLARVTLLGQGELSPDNFMSVAVQDDGNGGWLLLPDTDGILDFNYGYLIGQNSRTQALVASYKETLMLQIEYGYANKGEQMEIEVDHKGKKFNVAFDFSSVKWGGSPMAQLKLDGYQKMDIGQFVKSFSAF